MFSCSNLAYSVPALTEKACLGTQSWPTRFLLLRSSEPRTQTTEAHSHVRNVLSTGHPTRAETQSDSRL